jgi:ADP-ribose pyrophosphatase YjhB (NUDIX family)
VAKGKGTLKGMDDAKEARVFKLEEIPWDFLVFDHAQILRDFLKKEREEF